MKSSISLILIVLFVSILPCKGQDDCVFDSNAVTENFLKESENVITYSWNDQDKTGKAILKNGGTLHIQKWACNHFGTKAELFISSFQEQKNYSEYLKDLVSILDDKTPSEKVLDFLKTNRIDTTNKDELEFNLSDDSYPEFYINIFRNRDFLVFVVYYYTN